MADTFRISEIFGPTIQGEGRYAGMSCHFIRFGGCDYDCLWCDSKYAVDAREVRKLPLMTAEEIYSTVVQLPQGPEWVVLTGGNPVLYKLNLLVLQFQKVGFKIAVETQGSIWRDWLPYVDSLCVSPKPPSSGMSSKKSLNYLTKFMLNLGVVLRDRTFLKVVVFTEEDYEFAVKVRQLYPRTEMYLSIGTEIGLSGERDQICDGLASIFETVANDARMADVRVLPQLHVLAWGQNRGH